METTATHPNPNSSVHPLMEPSPSPRIILRPSTTTTSTQLPTPSFTLTPTPSSTTPAPTTTATSDGVVVVGFIGSNQDDVTQLMNKIVDDNVFGSGKLDIPVSIDETETSKEWFKRRKISYWFDKEKRMVFLQFLSNKWCGLGEESRAEAEEKLEAVLEEEEFGEMQGMLFMFSVCHIIIFLQDGSHFNTKLLQKFRILQATKHTLVPFFESRIKPKSTTNASPSFSKPMISNNSFHGRGRGIANRHGPPVYLASGLGSYSSFFPGHCIPVILFVFVDDAFKSPNARSNIDADIEISSSNPSSNSTLVSRSSLPEKSLNPVAVLARPVSKSEGGSRKKLQLSLEAQIRLLIKKCRTLAGSEHGHTGSRGGSNSISPLLFSLDASRAVTLLDRKTIQKGASLVFATSLIEEVLNGKATPDILLLESHAHDVISDDIHSVKEFIFRHSDALRGRGGLVSNTNNGSPAGTGMVAVAAAAAAASTASGKPVTTVDLPTLEKWLNSCQLILNASVSGKRISLDNVETGKVRPSRGNDLRVLDPVGSALSCLEGGKSLNMKFSTAWCERVLPSAKELYTRKLPACYPTSLHEAHLEIALRAFNSMVKGPAVDFFRKKLEDECTFMWKCGRQLCDAVSLTGKPCMHQSHVADDAVTGSVVKPHFSGFVFLHACACGRSREIRNDPFDFETANVTFNCFQNCCKHLPAFELPKVSNQGPVHSSSWSLIRVGGPRYYQPSKGLLQSGFCATDKLLLKWSISFENETNNIVFPVGVTPKGSIVCSVKGHTFDPLIHADTRKSDVTPLISRERQTEDAQKQTKHIVTVSSDDKGMSFGRGVPQFTMRRPFAEVVAGSVATDVSFPPLQQRKNLAFGPERSVKEKVVRGNNDEKVHINGHSIGFQKASVSSVENSQRTGATSFTEDGQVLQIGGIAPVNKSSGPNTQSNISLKHVTVYVGAEHECPYGHRFLLSPDHLNQLGPLYTFPEKSDLPPLLDKNAADKIKVSRSSTQERILPLANGKISNSSRVAFPNISKQIAASNNQQRSGLGIFSGLEDEENHCSTWPSLTPNPQDTEKNIEKASLDDNRSAFFLLNSNLPIYMNCPHCTMSKRKEESKVNYASTVSQLQRIFLVTPPFPMVIATRPIVQFEASCLPSSVLDHERQSEFSFGSQVILPPDSFITLRLPFIYGVQCNDRSLHPLNHFEDHPELTAWIKKGTILQIMTKGSSPNLGSIETKNL